VNDDVISCDVILILPRYRKITPIIFAVIIQTWFHRFFVLSIFTRRHIINLTSVCILYGVLCDTVSCRIVFCNWFDCTHGNPRQGSVSPTERSAVCIDGMVENVRRLWRQRMQRWIGDSSEWKCGQVSHSLVSCLSSYCKDYSLTWPFLLGPSSLSRKPWVGSKPRL
jgi:hypothetical protein